MKKLLTITLLIFVVFVIAGCIKIPTEKRLYQGAAKECGADNVSRVKYPSGNIDFRCTDYSKAIYE